MVRINISMAPFELFPKMVDWLETNDVDYELKCVEFVHIDNSGREHYDEVPDSILLKDDEDATAFLMMFR